MTAYREPRQDEIEFLTTMIAINTKKLPSLRKWNKYFTAKRDVYLPAEREWKREQLRKEHWDIATVKLLNKITDVERTYWIARRNEIEMLLDDGLLDLQSKEMIGKADEQVYGIEQEIEKCEKGTADAKHVLKQGFDLVKEKTLQRRAKKASK